MTTSHAPAGPEQLEELGPIDYIVLEWPGRQPSGEAAPLLADLVDRGIIRILDVAFMVKGEDGSVAALDLGALGEETEFAEFAGASSGLIGQDDLEEAANALEPGTSAARADLGEPLGRARRGRDAALRRPARRERPHPRPSHPRRARRDRGHDLIGGLTMPGLLRGVARTAVIAGTATSVSNRVSRRQARRWGAQEAELRGAGRYAEPPPPPPPPAAAPAADPDRAAHASSRSCRDRGVLTDEEFAAAKAQDPAGLSRRGTQAWS